MAEERVSHRKWGIGAIKLTRHGRYELYVEFETGLRWVKIDEVVPLAEFLPPSVTESLADLIAPDTLEEFSHRRIIEALRMGVVPADSVESFTLGRENEAKQLSSWLLNDESGSGIILGEYGSGKSHFLNYAFSIALKKGFAVARVDLEPNGLPLHKPKRVYAKLINTLRYNSRGAIKGFRDFLRDVLDEKALLDHEYFRYVANGRDNENVWSWIEAAEALAKPLDRIPRSKDGPLPGLYDYAIAANIYCYILSSLSWAAKEVLKLKGILLLFDEAETVDNFTNTYQDSRAHNFLRALILTSANHPHLIRRPQRAGEYRYAGLEYSVSGIARGIPFIYRIPTSLKILFAFTPTKALESLSELCKIPRIALSEFPSYTQRKVIDRVREMYECAYSLQIDVDKLRGMMSPFSSDTPVRHCVKKCVEAMDLIRFGRDGIFH